MPRLTPVQTSFAAGEVAPTIYSRKDLEKYFSAAERIENYLVLPQGGVTRRPGTRFVAVCKNADSRAVVRPFQFSATQSYILEMGCGYTRFYKANARLMSGTTPIEVSTPYTEVDLYDLDFVQSADVLYTLNALYAPRKFERYADTCWRFRTVTFKPPPTTHFGARPVTDLVTSKVSGDDATFTANNVPAGIVTFNTADVGREVLVTGGANAGARAGIKSITGGSQILAFICEPFVNLTATCATNWKITGSPLTAVTPGAGTAVGTVTTINLTAAGLRGAVLSTDSDCGKFAMINGGVYEIQQVTSNTSANAIIRGTPSSVALAPSGSWTIEEALWSTANGFPETGDFHDDRLFLNGGYILCGSKTGDYENFSVGTLDDDAVVFPINAKTINTIRAIVASRSLQIFTAGGEYIASGGGADDPITPTNIRISAETNYASRGVTPIRIGETTLFVARSGRQLREFTLRGDTTLNVYAAPDLLLLAEHLTEGGTTIVDLAYQREPRSTLWAVRSDGVMLVCTYRREENVVAWSRAITCGNFESVAVIPHPDGDRDQVWVTVKRTINGATTRSVEYFDDCTFYYTQLHTDCAMTCNTGAAVTTVGQLAYLEGMTVDVIGDGVVQENKVVSGGQITINTAATKIEVGLHYDSTVTTLRPEIAIGGNSSMFSKVRWAQLFVKFLRTMGASIATDSSKPLLTAFACTTEQFTGDVHFTNLGWDCAVVTVQQTKPLPSTVLVVGGILDLGGT